MTDLTDDELAQALPHLQRADQVGLIRQRARDLTFFVSLFFPERFDAPWSDLHRHLLQRPKTPWNRRTEDRHRALAAPRGNAKSSLTTFADVAHDVCYGFERFIGIVSTDESLSDAFVKTLYLLFSEPPDLFAEVYGPIRVEGTKTDCVIYTSSGDPFGTRLLSTSMRGTVRGKQHATTGTRFTRFVCDDIEHPKHVLSPTQRQYDRSFIDGDICKAGPTTGGLIVDVVGTVLHPDSVLAQLLKEPGWSHRVYRSIIEWPARMDLWERCRAIWANLDDEDRLQNARAFYEAHQTEMDAGAVVLWPDVEPIYKLMVMWWEGASAFYRDKQNDPRDPERQIFYPEKFATCTWDRARGLLTTAAGKQFRLSELDIAIWHDRAKGGASNDYPATAVVARDPKGYRYVLDVLMKREPASGQQARIWSLWEGLQPARRVQVGCDDTAQTETFSAAFERQREERRRAGRAYNLHVQSFTLDNNKNARIGRLEPDCLNGWLQFAKGLPHEVAEHFRQFPTGAHDDAPDAIERADWLVCGGGIGELTSGYLR